MSMRVSLRLIVLLIMAIGAVTALALLPIKGWLIETLEWIGELGYWGPVAVVILYLVSCVLLLPGSILTIGTGFLFQLVGGTITVSIGSTLGACLAFIVGRTLARRWVENKIADNVKFAAIDQAVGRQGLRIVLLTRLSPVFPFNLLNYAFGVTKIPFWKYVLGSWVGMIPGTIMYVYIGAGLRSLSDMAVGGVETGPTGRVLFWAGMAATVVVTVVVTRLARKALRDNMPSGD
jgi:uncharacterized membrane protein YdjX (TVP38/TMEM64 family)